MRPRARLGSLGRLLALVVLAAAVSILACGTSPTVGVSVDASAPVDVRVEAGPVLDAATTLSCIAQCSGLCGEILDSCGNVVDCGGCDVGQVCGAGGPNHCGVGMCTPLCQSCGSDGCAGLCGLCGVGQACVGGACICDPVLCSGCCTADGTCNTSCACGGLGQPCCNGGSACTAGLSCNGGLCGGCTSSCKYCGEDDGCGHLCTTGECPFNKGASCANGCVSDCPTGCRNGVYCVTDPAALGLCGNGGELCRPCGSAEAGGDSSPPDTGTDSDGAGIDASSPADSGSPDDSASGHDSSLPDGSEPDSRSDAGGPDASGGPDTSGMQESGSGDTFSGLDSAPPMDSATMDTTPPMDSATMDTTPPMDSAMDTALTDGPPLDMGSTSSEGGACFPAGTPVAMADGLSVAIESIREGDRVQSFDPSSGRVIVGRVLDVVRHDPSDSRGALVLVNGSLEATVDHPFFADGHRVRADGLVPGMSLLLLSEMGAVRTDVVRTVERVSTWVPTYELRVDGSGLYFVTSYAVMQKNPHN